MDIKSILRSDASIKKNKSVWFSDESFPSTSDTVKTPEPRVSKVLVTIKNAKDKILSHLKDYPRSPSRKTGYVNCLSPTLSPTQITVSNSNYSLKTQDSKRIFIHKKYSLGSPLNTSKKFFKEKKFDFPYSDPFKVYSGSNSLKYCK
jgi:hypothetical protein